MSRGRWRWSSVTTKAAASPWSYRKTWPGAVSTIAKDLAFMREYCKAVSFSSMSGRVQVKAAAYHHMLALIEELQQAVERDRRKKRKGRA
jgi:hypothetical protein